MFSKTQRIDWEAVRNRLFRNFEVLRYDVCLGIMMLPGALRAERRRDRSKHQTNQSIQLGCLLIHNIELFLNSSNVAFRQCQTGCVQAASRMWAIEKSHRNDGLS